jgi:hypothetical protein
MTSLARTSSNPPALPILASPLFRKSRAYAQRFGEAWVVFSAKYGFLHPDELIENYNVTFKMGGPDLVTVERLREQITEKALNAFSRIIVLGGRPYVDRVRLAFTRHNVQILDPMEGMPIGKRLQWLSDPEPPSQDSPGMDAQDGQIQLEPAPYLSRRNSLL